MSEAKATAAAAAAEARAACGGATAALRDHNRALAGIQLQLSGLLQRRAAERAAHAAGCAAASPLEQDPDCCVCYEPLDRPHAVVTACGHVYHRACVENAIETGKGKCPICRRTVHAAELVQIMNGLPARRDSAEVVDLVAGSPPRAPASRTQAISIASSDESDFASFTLRPKSKKRPRSSSKQSKDGRQERNDSTEVVGRAIDGLIRDLLNDFGVNRMRAEHLVELERSLEAAVQTVEKTCARVVAEGEAEKQRLRKEASARKVEHKAAMAKLHAAHRDVAETREQLNEQAADARKLQDQLLINIKATEAAADEARREKEAASELCRHTEKKRERFQAIAQLYEHKKRSFKAETEKMDSLMAEITKLKNMNEALRIQVRKAHDLPPRNPPQHENKVPLLSFDIIDDLDHAVGHGTAVASSAREAIDDADDDDDSDDDIVAAAERRFSRIKRQPSHPTPVQPSDSTSRASFKQQERDDAQRQRAQVAEGIFGALQMAESPGPIRPPPPRSMRRRRGDGRSAVGVAAFRPSLPPPAPKVGAIAAPRLSKDLSGSTCSISGKRSVAPRKPSEQMPLKPSSSKRRNSKISAFFK